MSDTKTMSQIQYERKWECRNCHTFRWWNYDTLAKASEPLCPTCGNAMSLSSDEKSFTQRLTVASPKSEEFHFPAIRVIYMEKWTCPDCGNDVDVDYDSVSASGTPVCSKCDCDMERDGASTIFVYLP